MPAPCHEAEPTMETDLKDWGRKLQQESVPERLQVLAAQLRDVLLQRKAGIEGRRDS